jgi:hypothetical protein
MSGPVVMHICAVVIYNFLSLLMVVQGQMRVGWRAGFQRLKTGTFG